VLARGVRKRGFATAGTCRNKREREREDEHDRIIENMVVVVVLKKNDEK
jgi:hypothetical protein